MNRASDVSASDSHIVPPRGTNDDAHCCGVLSLGELRECGRRGIHCGPELCARERIAELHAERQLRIAQLTIQADSLDGVWGGFISAQLRDLRDLLERGVGW